MITKENILNLLSEEEIFERYLGMSVQFTKGVTNPLRTDNSPDCYFIIGRKKIFFMDYAQPDYGGDCFEVCAIYYRYQLPGDFYKVLQEINRDFNLNLEKETVQPTRPKRKDFEKKYIPKPRARIKAKIRKFDREDLEYWEQYGIKEETLRKYKVFRADFVWINGDPYYEYSTEKCYVYLFSDNTLKIYRPSKISYKWRTNSLITQGYDQLPEKGELLIITKSLKDVMTLHDMGYIAIAPQAEGHTVPEIQELKERFERIVVFFDNDIPGVKSSINLTKKLGLDYFNIPKEYQEKDPSDFIKKYGKEALRKLMSKKGYDNT